MWQKKQHLHNILMSQTLPKKIVETTSEKKDKNFSSVPSMMT